MSLTGGKRKVNKSLKAWVTFVKKVQKEEKLSYKDAIHRAKVRKDKGEKWMVGGVAPTTSRNTDNVINDTQNNDDAELGPMPDTVPRLIRTSAIGHTESAPTTIVEEEEMEMEMEGGRRRRRKTHKRRGSRKGRTMRRRRASRRR